MRNGLIDLRAPNLVAASLLYLTGNLVLQCRPELPPLGWLIGSVILAIGLFRPRFGWMPGVMLLGFGWAGLYAHWHAPAELPEGLLGTDLWAVGRIDAIPERQTDRLRFPFVIERIESAGQALDGKWRVRLSWYDSSHRPRGAERWRLKVRVRPAVGMGNPGGFDYVGWLYQRGIRYAGYVRSDERNERLRDAPSASLLGIRQRIADALANSGLSGRASALVRALAVGDRSGLTRDDWAMLAKTGTSHLMAISGLHIGLVVGIAWLLGSLVWRRVPALANRWPARLGGALLALVAATGYAALAGFALPTQRALLMFGLVIGALLVRRRLVAFRTLAMAMLLVLCWDPLAALSGGFWLSFLAVAAILFVLTDRLRQPERWRGAIKVQAVLLPALAPVLWVHFQRLSMIAPFVNLLLVPLFGLILVPLSLLGALLLYLVPELGQWLLQPAGWLIDQIWFGLEWAAELEFAQLTGPAPPRWALLFAGIGVLWLAAPIGANGRPLALLLFLPLFLPISDRPDDGAFRFRLLDVGQGLSAIVQTRHRLLVYDTGPRFRSGFDTGKSIVAPYLRRMGYDRIDRLIVSHGDNDHAGGFEGLASEIKIASLWSGEPARLGLPAEPCHDAQRWEWDGVSFEILHPDARTDFRSNDRSCVLKVENGAGSVLLGADIESPAEQRLVREHRTELKTDVLLIPHHGSKTSSTAPFIAATDPEWLLIQVGAHNRFGFPVAEVVDRWHAQGARSLRTDRLGSMRFDFGADGQIKGPIAHWATHKRYWHEGVAVSHEVE